MEKLKSNIPTQSKLLIIILSSANNHERRDAQLKTWIKDLKNIPYYFLIGNSSDTQIKSNFIFVNVKDNDLPNKLYEAYKFCLKNIDFDYIFTCDDDTYVVVDRLLTSGYENHDFMGTLYRYEEGDRKGLTHAEGGAGFFIGRSALQKMFSINASDLLKTSFASDTFISDLATESGISLTHHNDFNQGWSMEKRPGEIPRPNNSAITSHYMNRKQFFETYKSFHPANIFLI